VTTELPLNHEALRFLAAQGGLATGDSHLDELFPYVQSVLSGVRRLDQIDVAGTEPELVFVP
jgi:hypothetical protein